MLSAFAFGLTVTLATLAGGLLALRLRLRDRIVLVLGIIAGVVLGVAVFDLISEAIELGRGRCSTARSGEPNGCSSLGDRIWGLRC
ncbi:MAG TPA: hypothetical protein VF695_16180 [Sphingomonas sp.]|jgi:ZIP family zinc transporter